MYALQYVLHSLCGGGYYNMRVPNIPVSNRHDKSNFKIVDVSHNNTAATTKLVVVN